MLEKNFFESLSKKPNEFRLVRAFKRIFITKETNKITYEYDRIIISDDVSEYFDKEGKTIVLCHVDFEGLYELEINTLSALAHKIDALEEVIKIYPDYTEHYNLFTNNFTEPEYLDTLIMDKKLYLVFCFDKVEV